MVSKYRTIEWITKFAAKLLQKFDIRKFFGKKNVKYYDRYKKSMIDIKKAVSHVVFSSGRD